MCRHDRVVKAHFRALTRGGQLRTWPRSFVPPRRAQGWLSLVPWVGRRIDDRLRLGLWLERRLCRMTGNTVWSCMTLEFPECWDDCETTNQMRSTNAKHLILFTFNFNTFTGWSVDLQVTTDDALPVLYESLDEAVNEYCSNNKQFCCQSLIALKRYGSQCPTDDFVPVRHAYQNSDGAQIDIHY